MKKSISSLLTFFCIITFFAVVTTPRANAKVTATFSGGTGTETPDQWTGVAGDGWMTAWDGISANGTVTTFAVKDEEPFGSGGNYLQVDYLKTATGTARSGIRRRFVNDGGAGIDITKPYIISFAFRIDSLVGWNSSADQFAFSTESSQSIGSFGQNAPWSIWLRGDNGWAVGNGKDNNTVSYLNFSELGLTEVIVGKTYQFEIFVNPAIFRYDATITVDGVTYRASDLNGGEMLGFRTNAGAVNANWFMIRNTLGDPDDAVTWSVDNIQIIPEPGAVGVAVGGFFLMTTLWLRRRSR